MLNSLGILSLFIYVQSQHPFLSWLAHIIFTLNHPHIFFDAPLSHLILWANLILFFSLIHFFFSLTQVDLIHPLFIYAFLPMTSY